MVSLGTSCGGFGNPWFSRGGCVDVVGGVESFWRLKDYLLKCAWWLCNRILLYYYGDSYILWQFLNCHTWRC